MNFPEKSSPSPSHADERQFAARESRADMLSAVDALPGLRPTVYCPSPVGIRCLEGGRD